VIGSFGLNIGFQSDICQEITHSSFAFSIYLIIHSAHFGISVKLVVVVLRVSILANLIAIEIASPLVIGSFGLNIGFQSDICQEITHSSFAFSIYLIIHSAHFGISVKLVVVAPLITDIFNHKVAIARNSDLVECLSGLKVLSG
jgi:hypothetical protein